MQYDVPYIAIYYHIHSMPRVIHHDIFHDMMIYHVTSTIYCMWYITSPVALHIHIYSMPLWYVCVCVCVCVRVFVCVCVCVYMSCMYVCMYVCI